MSVKCHGSCMEDVLSILGLFNTLTAEHTHAIEMMLLSLYTHSKYTSDHCYGSQCLLGNVFIVILIS